VAEESKLEVIRKLLAKAEGAATAEEATAYNEKAAAMMARHGVNAALLAATGEKPDRIGERRIAMTDPYSMEKSMLASWIGSALGCRSVRHSGYGRSVSAITLHGYESDIGRTEVLYTSLLLQATRQVVVQRPPSWSDEATAAYRRTWLVGFATEVNRRLSAAEQTAAEEHDAVPAREGPSAALVVADRRSTVDRAFEDRYPKLKKARNRTLSGSGYGSGVAAGSRADLGGPRIANPRRELDR
jgi:Protein of unknown function (DUF2786)